jgi:hypothetical protein
MTSFLTSLKADLLDRRLLPLVVLVVLGAAAAIGYVALDGGSGSSAPAGSLGATPGTPAGLSVSQLSPEKAVAETTAGVADQRKGTARNPFKALPEPGQKTVKTASTNQPAASASPPGAASEAAESPGSTPATGESSTPAPAAPAKPRPVYHVAVLFGPAPVGEEQLTPYENLKMFAPIPSSKQPLIVFRGATSGGKSAIFAIVSEAIIKGQAKCVPSPSQCQSIELKEGQSEALEYISAAGQTSVYDLEVVTITPGKGSGASTESVLRGESKVGRELLANEGLIDVPGLRYSGEHGVAGHTARAGGAHRRHGR